MMTAEERAERAVYGLVLKIREAIAATYEECARIAESYGIGDGVAYKNLPRACEDIAAAIRARKDAP